MIVGQDKLLKFIIQETLRPYYYNEDVFNILKYLGEEKFKELIKECSF